MLSRSLEQVNIEENSKSDVGLFNPDRALMRFEFMDSILRIAHRKFNMVLYETISCAPIVLVNAFGHQCEGPYIRDVFMTTCHCFTLRRLSSVGMGRGRGLNPAACVPTPCQPRPKSRPTCTRRCKWCLTITLLAIRLTTSARMVTTTASAWHGVDLSNPLSTLGDLFACSLLHGLR